MDNILRINNDELTNNKPITMANFENIAKLASNQAFQEKIKNALLFVAISVKGEEVTGIQPISYYQKRDNMATQIIAGFSNLESTCRIVIMKSKTDLTEKSADDAIIAAVEESFDLLSGVGLADRAVPAAPKVA